jgi:dienelactone hydrolase
MRLTRRQLLLGSATAAALGGAFWAVEERVLPGRAALNELLGLDGPDGIIPTDEPGPTATGEFPSPAMSSPIGWKINYPPSSPAGPLPVVIALHGRGGNHASTDDLGIDRFLAAHVRAGGTPFAVASVDGADTYWHPRADGTDPTAMIADEFIPMLGGRGLDTARLGLIGWSMGGYGALFLATKIRPEATVAVSPAVWPRFDEIADGAFDDEPQFARDTIFACVDGLRGIPVRIDCGTDDPFYDNVELLRTKIDPTPDGGFQPGGHRGEYWRRMIPDQFTFLGNRLA